MTEEESFPRGGKIVRKRPRQENETLFSVSKPPKPKKQRTSRKQETQLSSEDAFQSINIRGSLTYNQIQPGMVILGCIRHVKNIALEVELPGLCFALINITEISDPFTKHLNRQLENNEVETNSLLSKMFSVGDFLPVKILNVEARDKGVHVDGSINPREIYADQNHNSFKKHMLVWSSITSEADHGYEMNMGVKSCRAFLPSKNVDVGADYGIGQPLWCVIHKADNSPLASTIRLSAKEEHIKSTIFDIENLHDIIPGTKVDFVSDKITAHGIQGKFSDNFIGFVDENYLSKPLKKLSDYQEGKILKAYVLFVDHTTKITHLSLRIPVRDEKPDILNVGSIVQGQVFAKANNGLFLTLPEGLKGFVTNRRVINTLAKKDNLNITQAINVKYPVGSRHQCRVLDYNYFSKTFICTPEQSIVKENVFGLADLNPGQLVNVNIVDIKDEGIVVAVGHVRGFVPNLHVTDIEYTSNVKKKFKPGQKIDARVLSIENEKLLLTLKPALVRSEECLTKLEDVKVGSKYQGVVSKLSSTGALVVFYGNVMGWVNPKGLGRDIIDPSKYFFMGQVVNVYVMSITGKRISLSLFEPQIHTFVGKRYSGIVKSINEDGITIQIENSNRTGFIPNVHLSSSLGLCQAVKNTFSPGDKIPQIMYVGGTKPQIFSRREGIANTRKLPKWHSLKVGSIIRCYCHSSSSNTIKVVPLIRDYRDLVEVSAKNITLVEHQLLMAKVEYINRKSKEIGLSIELKDVFKENVEGAIDQFSQHLLELASLYQYGKEHDWSICNYELGNRVDCKVEAIDPEGGCMVALPDGVKGIAVAYLCPRKLKEGNTIPGVIIGHDFEKQIVDVCLNPNISRRINSSQTGSLNGAFASSLAEKLLIKQDWIVSVLRNSQGNKQLVYLPTKVHENDFKGCLSYYDKDKFKICVCGKIDRFVIGLNKKLFLSLDKSVGLQMLEKTNSSKQEGELDQKQAIIIEEKQEFQANESDSGIEHNDIEVEESEEEHETITENKPVVTLPGISSFFSTIKKQPTIEDSSSEDEENGPTEKKKKKLSPAERAELLRQEEERVSKIERDLADPTKAPESAEQFDRILLAKPNSSELWAKYIAFHIAATEIDKARAVARKALDTINMTLTEEKFKIWMVLLNLENMFGAKESFDKTLEDALKFNDSLQVYLKVIGMLAESSKYTEMEVKIAKVRAKYKQDPIMWLEVGKTYYQIGQFKEARSCKERALKSISDKKSQMNIIIRFAIMEFKYGEQDHGCAIFEAILTTDPKKINVWSIYADQLIKKGRIDDARQVLERSVCQSLPLKSMKSLFMKFRKFEEEHGTPDTLEAVKQRALDCVAKFTKR